MSTMPNKSLRYSPLKGMYVDSKGRVVTERKTFKLPDLKALDTLSAVVLTVLGAVGIYFIITHNFYYKPIEAGVVIAVTPKSVKTFSFENIK